MCIIVFVNMSRWSELKEADLKRELEERHLDTTGKRSVLQQRLRQAIAVTGEDPYSVVFVEIVINKLIQGLKAD